MKRVLLTYLFFYQTWFAAVSTLAFSSALFAFEGAEPSSSEGGTWINPITDLSWKCLFPIVVARVDEGNGPKPCVCSGFSPKIGLPISYYEPSRIVEVTMSPYKLVAMGGIKLSESGLKQRGSFSLGKNMLDLRFYQVHWYKYPALFVFELLNDFFCIDKGPIDLAWMTEFDPTWNVDILNLIFHPEACILSSPQAHLACVADCLACGLSEGIDKMFWCAGCMGSVYPFSGYVSSEKDPWRASALLATRLIAKFHRLGFLRAYDQGQYCSSTYAPFYLKSQYRLQLAYPKRFSCFMPGQTQIFLEKATSLGREDFVYVLWKKKNCCLDPLFFIPSVSSGDMKL